MGKKIYLVCFFIFFPACASSRIAYVSQPQVNALVAANRFEEAAKAFADLREAYGPRNQLLYDLDKGYVFQFAGRTPESIRSFEQAQRTIDELYTKSVTNIFTTWLVSDNNAPYRGDPLEHVLVNIFQSLNFAVQGDCSEAVVEMRDMQRKLNILNDIYPQEGKHIYREDAFGRLLSGILYECLNNRQDLNEALIAYRKSLKSYSDIFYQNTRTGIPQVLKENILAAAQHLGFEEFQEYQRQFPGTVWLSIPEKQRRGEIYLIHYNGLSPLKQATHLPLILPGGYATQLAFARLEKRDYEIRSSVLRAEDSQGNIIETQTELAAHLKAMMLLNHEAKKVWLMTKGFLRPAGKYAAQRALEEEVKERYGEGAGLAVKGVGSLYNFFSEQADLRSWQTLPAEIRIGRLILEPGEYTLVVRHFDAGGGEVENTPLPSVVLKSSEKKFFIIRTVE